VVGSHVGLTLPETYRDFARLWAEAPEAQQRDGLLAVALATEACELSSWEDWTCLRTLAAAYAEFGQLDRALVWAEKALPLAREDGRALCQADLDRYRTAYR
jgi:hypothetical protein